MDTNETHVAQVLNLTIQVNAKLLCGVTVSMRADDSAPRSWEDSLVFVGVHSWFQMPELG
jgi:hypothetical protein